MESVCRTCMTSKTLRPLFPRQDQLSSFTRVLYLITGVKIKPDDGLPQNVCRGCSKIIKTAMRFRSQSQKTEKKLLQLFKCSLRTSDIGSASSKDQGFKEKLMLKAVGDVSEEKPMLKAFEDVPDEKPMLKSFEDIPEEKPMLKACEDVPEEKPMLKACEDVPEEKPVLKAFENLPDEKPMLIDVGNVSEEYEVKIEFVDWNTDVESVIKNDMTDLNNPPVPLDPEDLSSDDEPLCQKTSFSKSVVLKKNKTERKMKNRKPETFDRKRCLELIEGPLDLTQPIQCKICKKYSKSINTFENHALSHLGYNILCEFCAKPCMTKTDLLRHQRAKHGLAKGDSLPCSFCGFHAIYKEQLEVHERRVHTKERPFTCDDCDASFFSKRVLLQHRALRHKSDKPFKCDLCPSKFKLRSRLTRHMNRVHNKNDSKYSYGCHICSNRYSSSGETRNHLVKVHGVPLEQQGKIQRFHFQRQEDTK